jgi:two-component system NtrC family sensor kinase
LIGRRLHKVDSKSAAIEQTIEDIELIQRETARCGNIVKNLLLFSKKQVADYALVSVRHIVDKAEQIVKHHFAISNVQFEALFPPEDIALLCDENQIQQALVALFVNAVEAMPGGGKLIVEIKQESNEGDLNIFVKDSGVGITTEDLPHIFEPFYTTKKNGQGVGLGLSVVYGILERHGGRLSVDSEVGRGTTFTMVFSKTGTGGGRSGFPAGTTQRKHSSES